MRCGWMHARCALLLAGFVIGGYVHANDAGIEKVLNQLTKLKPQDYAQDRPGVLAGLKSSKERPDTSKLGFGAKLILESLTLEIKDPTLWGGLHARLRDTGIGPAPDLDPRRLRSKSKFAMVVVLCYGTQAFAPLAEDVLFARQGDRRAAVDAMVECRDARIVDVLIAALEDPMQDEDIRAHALWRLDAVLAGLPEKHFRKNAPLEDAIGSVVPEDLKAYATDKDLPALQVNPEGRGKALAAVKKGLGDSDFQVRAVAVGVLGSSPEDNTGALIEAMKTNSSAWVRALCAVELQKKDSKEAVRALDEAIRSEEDLEVLKVLRKTGRPFDPRQGVPGGSILAREAPKAGEPAGK